MRVDLKTLRFDSGGALLIKRALRTCGAGETIVIEAAADSLAQLRAWCRAEGHEFNLKHGEAGGPAFAELAPGAAVAERWSGAERAGAANPQAADAVADHPPQYWGLAARGALVESGSPEFHFALSEKEEVWAPEAARIYAQAAGAQWDPATAIPWNAEFHLPDEVEDAVVQIMTYLVENETAALIVPSRFVAQLHPHFREVLQVLAIQAADEARHIEVFTRRALMNRRELGLSTAGGQASLKTLVDEPDFATASFLLSVLGEAAFLALLRFLEKFAPDPVTASVCRLAAQDEARHVAFGMAHIREHIQHDPALRDVLLNAVRQRHRLLQHTAGLNEEVYDALLLIAAGSWEPAALARGYEAVTALNREMHTSRTQRLLRLGFTDADAEEMSALHTRNFM